MAELVKGPKDGHNSDCMEETENINKDTLSTMIRTIFLPDTAGNICKSKCQHQRKM